MTGEADLRAIKEIARRIPFENPLTISAGIIGTPFPVEKIIAGLKRLIVTRKPQRTFMRMRAGLTRDLTSRRRRKATVV